MTDFRSAFEDALRELGYGEAPERRLTPAQISAQARAIAESEGVKYKSARRRLERRRTSGQQARGQPNRAFAQRVRQRGLRVHAELEIDPSPGAREQFRPRTIDVVIPGNQLDGMAAALDRGDLRAAEREFTQALLREYEGAAAGSPSFLEGALIGEVDALDIGWGEGRTAGGVYFGGDDADI